MKETVYRYRLLILLPPLAFLAVFYFYPLTGIFGQSILPGGSWDLSGIKKLVSTGYYLKVLWFTTWQAAVSTILTLLIGLPGAYVFGRFTFPGKGIVQALTAVPFVLPTVVVAAAFRALLGKNGLVNDVLAGWAGVIPPIDIDQTVWFILLAHVFYNYTLVIRIVGGFWSNLETGLPEAARMLGASPWTTFRKVTLPLLAPAISAAALLIFIFCFTSFGVVLILGGPRLATLEVEIYRQAVYMYNLPMAAVLSLIQIIFTFVLMWVYTWIGRRYTLALTPEDRGKTQRPVGTTGERLFLGSNLVFMAILLGLPLAALVLRSFMTENGFGLAYYQALFTHEQQSIFFVAPAASIRNSLIFALGAMTVALLLGLLASVYLADRKNRGAGILDPLFMLPLSTSAVTLGFGFIVTLDSPPLNLRNTLALTPIAHALVAFPFVVRCILPSLRGIPGSLREAASVLGASPTNVWRHVDLPIVARAMLVGAVFAFSVSLGEFGATAFVARPNAPTMPLAIFRFLSQPGSLNYGQAMAMSAILMLVTAAGFLFLDKFRLGRLGEF